MVFASNIKQAASLSDLESGNESLIEDEQLSYSDSGEEEGEKVVNENHNFKSSKTTTAF
jgi:hypothetical protein